jgi:rSAM/selenodomain-associated transferase 1
MSSRFAIGIMARAPVAGAAKTRLIPMLGADGAADLQRELTLRTLATASAAAPGAVTLFTAGDAGHPFWSECVERFGVTLAAQQGEHLGERMWHALATLLRTHRRALLIGTDCPVLQSQHLRDLDAGLQRARMAFIPAEDGGYVAVGAREPAAVAFGALDWGSPQVMPQTRAALDGIGWRAGDDWHELATLWDVDRPPDLQRAFDSGLVATIAVQGRPA